jgi:hypothetical protein
MDLSKEVSAIISDPYIWSDHKLEESEEDIKENQIALRTLNEAIGQKVIGLRADAATKCRCGWLCYWGEENEEMSVYLSRPYAPIPKEVACTVPEFIAAMKEAKERDLPIIHADEPRDMIIGCVVLKGSGPIRYTVPLREVRKERKS